MAVIIPMTAIAAWALSTGQISYVITHGVSMNPVYHQDDLIFVARAGSYEVGQIAAYRGSTSGIKVLHRIVGGDPTRGFIFKGDNNTSIDTDTPTAPELIGRAVLHVPKGGVWLKPLLSPTGLGMMGFLIASAGATLPRNRREVPRGRRKKKVKAMARQPGTWATALAAAKAVRRMPPYLRALSGLVGVAAVLALVLGVLGWMKPVLIQQTSGTPREVAFSYSAKVPRSAAYDGTTAASPDPIFRKLADRVDLRVRYKGTPGTLEVTADLTTATGWRATMPLIPATKITGTAHEAGAALDLAQIDQRVKAGAAAIGAPVTPVKITVNARVTGTGYSFVAPAVFDMDPLRFVRSGGLTITDPDAVSTVTGPRTIWPSGMAAAGARSWAILLLLLAAAGAVVVFLFARRETPVRTRSEIERRYPQLIVPVEPMASPPGKPVVNVASFPALVKLAERYGQMILTWSRQDADDFVVRDEGITYRYRTDLENPGSGEPLVNVDEGIPPRSRRRATAKGVLTGTEDRPTSHRYSS